MPEKTIDGRKRHVLVETQGWWLAVRVHRANLPDRSSAPLLLGTLPRLFPRRPHLFADTGSTGAALRAWITQHLGWTVDMVPSEHNESHQTGERRDGVPVRVRQPKGGFQVQRKRWVIERTQTQNP